MLTSKLVKKYFQVIFIFMGAITLNACQNNLQIEKALNPPQISLEIPQNIPQYPQGKLIKFSASDHAQTIKFTWEIRENLPKIKTDYQQVLKEQNWQIITPFDSNLPDSNKNLLIAQKDNFEIKILLTNNNPTQLTLEYRQQSTNLAQNNSIIEDDNPQPSPSVSVTPNPTVNPTPTATQTPDNQVNLTETFTDLTDLPDNFQQYINDLNQLKIFNDNEITNNQFNPNQPIKKRDFVRWLVQTNNKIYDDDPTKQIRLNNQTSEVAFRDILPDDPDFQYIQALAETGIIFSPLTDKNQADLFNPDQPLTREELILWKVSFDVRQALPKADLKLIEETWGFQDASKINPQVFNALYSDFQNNKYSNIKRVFSFTKLFQPQKTVTRAEAVACLWYFGTENDGISIKDFLEKNKNS